MNRAQNCLKEFWNFTQTTPFVFCDLSLKALGYKEIDTARTLPSVTFKTARRQTSEHQGRETAQTHHGAEHKRGGVM